VRRADAKAKKARRVVPDAARAQSEERDRWRATLPAEIFGSLPDATRVGGVKEIRARDTAHAQDEGALRGLRLREEALQAEAHGPGPPGRRPPGIHRTAAPCSAGRPLLRAEGEREGEEAALRCVSRRSSARRNRRLESFELATHKTKALAGAIHGLGIEGKALLSTGRGTKTRPGRPQPSELATADALGLNVYDALNAGTIVPLRGRPPHGHGGAVVRTPQSVIVRPS